MKRVLSSGLSALLLTTATTALAFPALSKSAQSTLPAKETIAPTTTRLASAPTAPIQEQAYAPMTFNFSAPIVTNSGVLGSTHFIRVAVIGMSLKTLMLSIPSQMEKYEAIRVMDQTGSLIPANVTADGKRVAIAFNQPVAPGSTVEVLFTGVQMRGGGGETLFYGVTAERVGLIGEIPVGTARVQVPGRD